MKVSLIVATDLNRGIGKNNDLMWHLPSDMQFFKKTTTNHIVVMGRKNFESIPERFRPLPNRENVILTRNPAYHAENCLVFNSLEACFDHFKKETEKTIFIIGGGEIYAEALNSGKIQEMFITTVNHVFDADTFFPAISENDWKLETIQKVSADEKNPYDFVIKRYFK